MQKAPIGSGCRSDPSIRLTSPIFLCPFKPLQSGLIDHGKLFGTKVLLDGLAISTIPCRSLSLHLQCYPIEEKRGCGCSLFPLFRKSIASTWPPSFPSKGDTEEERRAVSPRKRLSLRQSLDIFLKGSFASAMSPL